MPTFPCRKLILLLSLGGPWLLCVPRMLWAQPVLCLTDTQEQYAVGQYLEYLEDPNGALTLDDVRSSTYAGQFIRSRERVPNFGYTNSVYWVRIRVRNVKSSITAWRLELEFANMHDITLYRPHADGTDFEALHTGTRQPFATRDIPYHRFVFALSVPIGTDQTIYLRCHNGASMTLPLTLWSAAAFRRRSQLELFLAGLFYGTLLLILGYNSLLWLALRVRGHLYYVLFIASLVPTQFVYDGFAAQYLWPEGLWRNPLLVPFLLACVVITSLKFTDGYLGLRTRAPSQHRLILGSLLVWGAILAFFPFAQYATLAKMVLSMSIVSDVIILICSTVMWRLGYKPLRFFWWAWLVVAVTLLTFLLVRLGVAPSSPVTEHSYRLGIVLMALFLTLAFADRIQLVLQEKAVTQFHLMMAFQDRERLVREQNVLLERKVAARTAELQQYRDHLEERVQEEVDLRQQQERLLIQKSKLESLGVLAAGIAHEINQPLSRIAFSTDSILLKLINHETVEANTLERKCEVIQKSVDRMKHIIAHIRTFSRDQHTLRSERIDVHATIHNALTLIQTQYHHHNIMIETDLQATGWVLGNQYKLEQVILNLLSNAKDAIEAKPDDITSAFQEDVITIRTTNTSDQIEIEIADTGEGMSEEMLEHLFDPFFTTKEVGKGTGLGLSISYGIVKEMGGAMFVASQERSGTSMKIVLPRIHEQEGSML